MVTGIPKILAIDSDEVRKSISEQVETIVETVRIALEQTPPELAADIVDTGIVLTGGGSLPQILLSCQEPQAPGPTRGSVVGRLRGRQMTC